MSLDFNAFCEKVNLRDFDFAKLKDEIKKNKCMTIPELNSLSDQTMLKKLIVAYLHCCIFNCSNAEKMEFLNHLCGYFVIFHDLYSRFENIDMAMYEKIILTLYTSEKCPSLKRIEKCKSSTSKYCGLRCKRCCMHYAIIYHENHNRYIDKDYKGDVYEMFCLIVKSFDKNTVCVLDNLCNFVEYNKYRISQPKFPIHLSAKTVYTFSDFTEALYYLVCVYVYGGDDVDECGRLLKRIIEKSTSDKEQMKGICSNMVLS